jgi:FAD/FMN-containing dehydrogenase
MDSDTILCQLEGIVGSGYVTDDPAELWCYTGNLLPTTPQYVVRPGTVAEVAKVVKLATEHLLPIIPRGLATRNSPRRPGVHPTTQGGLILETTRLKGIREIDEPAMTVTAEAGVTMAELANKLASQGLRVVEGSVTPYCATVGALTGVGPGLRKYGRREQHILDIEVVLGNGEVIHTAGADGGQTALTALLIASQGIACLGVITAVTYRMFTLPESLDYLDFEFLETSGTIRFLQDIDRAGVAHLPTVFQVNAWPEAVLRLYANMPWVRSQNEEMKKLLDRFPPFPADIVGVILEGTRDHVDVERNAITSLAIQAGGRSVGPEPIRDYYVNRNWTGNTKCHEDASRHTTSWAEPFFLCPIERYGEAKALAEQVAHECGFDVGERFWARGSLRSGSMGYTVCVTFDDTVPDERKRANRFVEGVLASASHFRKNMQEEASSKVGGRVISSLKAELDPLGLMFPGILYLD